MRILSKYTDYYDNVQSLGMDKDCVYVRKQSSITVPHESAIVKLIEENWDYHSHVFFYPKNRMREKYAMKLARFVVGYCGTLLMGYKFTHFNEDREVKANYFFHPLKAEKYIQKHKHTFHTYTDSYMYSEGVIDKFRLNDWKEYVYIQSLSETIPAFFQELQVPVFVFPASILSTETYEEARDSASDYYYRQPDANFLLNPQLKKLEFFRYKDPYACYQDIYQFLSGVLTKRENIDTAMTDLDKVNQHGFDEKYGFRNRPGSKKKRKKKKNG